MLVKFSADDILKYLSCFFFCFFFLFFVFLFFSKNKVCDFMQICFEYLTLYFLRKIRKNINLLSAEFAQRVLKVNDITVHVYLMLNMLNKNFQQTTF